MKSWIQILTFTLLVALGGCKDKDPNPCANQKPTTANFKVWERSWGTTDEQFLEWYPQWQDMDADTIATETFVAEAEEPENPNDLVTYRWEVGSEILTTRKVSRTFANSVPPFFDLKLTVTKKPNKNCNPSDPGIATFTRRIYHTNVRFAWEGVWHGYINDNPADTVTVYIIRGTETSEPAPCRTSLSFGNFPIRGWYSIFSGGSTYYQFGRTGGGTCVPTPDQTWVPQNRAYGIVDKKTGKITIESGISRLENGVRIETKNLKFIGTKVK